MGRLAHAYGERLLGVHLNFLPLPLDIPFPAALTDEHRAYQEEISHWQSEETGYSLIQGTKPQTLAYALTDSPAGLAAWIAEKFDAWIDHDGELERSVDLDSLLTNVTLYWATGGINSSFWPYYAIRHGAVACSADAGGDTDRVRVLPPRDPASSALPRRAGLQHPALDRDAPRRALRCTRGSGVTRRRRDGVLPFPPGCLSRLP